MRCFSHESFVFLHINALSCFHTEMSSIVFSPTVRRFSCFHTQRATHIFVLSHTDFVYLPTIFRAFTHRAFLFRLIFQRLVASFRPLNTVYNYLFNTHAILWITLNPPEGLALLGKLSSPTGCKPF